MRGFRVVQIFRVVLLATLAALNGCGLFGNDDNVAPTGMVIGMAIKGVLNNALVTAREIIPGAAPVTLGIACTNSAGTYALAYNGYTGGPVLISVDPADASGCLGNGQPTTSTCDAATGCGATAFGANFTIPPGTKLNLHALIDSATPVQMAAITPFSEVAARNALRAINGGAVTDVDAVNLNGMDAAALALLAKNAVAAYRQIEKLPLFAGLGADFNLLTTQPADITKDFTGGDGALSAGENQAAGFGSLCGAVLQAFFDDGGSSGNPAAALSMATNKLATSFTGEGILNDDTGANDSAAFSLKDLTDALRKQDTASGAATTTGYNNSNITAQESASNGQSGFSSPPPDATSLLSWNLGSWNLSVWQ